MGFHILIVQYKPVVMLLMNMHKVHDKLLSNDEGIQFVEVISLYFSSLELSSSWYDCNTNEVL